MADPLITPTYFEQAADIVRSQIDEMSDRADSSLATANQTIAQLTGLEPSVQIPAPVFEETSIRVPTQTLPDAPTSAVTITVDPFAPIEFERLTFDDGLALETPGPFEPRTGLLNIPEPPAPIVATLAPVRPEIGTITIPTAPQLLEPELGDLMQIQIPEFTFPGLPTFEDTGEPVFDGAAPNVVMQWAETPYASPVLDALKAEILRQMAGGTGLHPDIEAALFARARSRDDEQARKALQEAVDLLASRGFELPSGVLAAQINATIESSRMAAGATNRDILVQASQLEQENLRNAVAQGIALETVLIQQHQQMVDRSFQAAKARLDAEVQLYGVAVQLFNARQSARSIAVEVFKARLSAALAHLEEFRARIEAAKAAGDYNKVQAEIFGVRMDALRRRIEVYSAQMDAARTQADIERLRIDAWRGEIEAWSTGLNVRRIEWEGYKTRVDAEAAKAGMFESESRAYAATVAAAEGRNNTKVAVIRSRIDALQASVGLFSARVSAETQRIGSQLEEARTRVQSFAADVQRFSAEVGADSADRGLRVQALEADLRNHIAMIEVLSQQWQASQQTLVQRANLQAEAIKAAGAMASQLAAGAYSAMHVQASLSGSGSGSTSNSYSRNDNYNYTG